MTGNGQTETGEGRTGWAWYYCDAVRGEEPSRRAAQRALARAIGRATLRGLRVAHGGGGETYYYRTQAEADADGDGAYAWAVYPLRGVA